MTPLDVRFEAVGSSAPARVGWFLHGILGRGRNWRSFARRLADARPDLRLLLVDLRCHGDAPPLPGPHDLAACSADLQRLAEAEGPPDLVVGHSFGGKVALRLLADGMSPRVTWVLDSPPGVERVDGVAPGSDPFDPREGAAPLAPQAILEVLRAIPTPAPTRDRLRAPLRAAGIPEPIVAWLLSSTVEGPDGWRFVWDLDGVAEMLRDYLRWDAWPTVRAATSELHLVRAGRSDRWSPADLAELAAVRAPVHAHVLERAGHWLHVDDPDGLLALMAG